MYLSAINLNKKSRLQLQLCTYESGIHLYFLFIFYLSIKCALITRRCMVCNIFFFFEDPVDFILFVFDLLCICS